MGFHRVEVQEQCVGERVPGDVVEIFADDERWGERELVQEPLNLGARHGRFASGGGALVDLLYKAFGVGAFCRSESQRCGQSVEYGFGGRDPALLDASVVVVADGYVCGDLFATKPTDPTDPWFSCG